MKVTLNKSLPSFKFHSTDPHLGSFDDLKGTPFVLYFYPKDNTPGCTIEGQDFRDAYSQFKKLKIQIIGVSRDNLASHEKFACKLQLPFPLIADEQEKLCQLFGVIAEKKLYGRKVMGIERSTFFIDAQGVLRHIWRKVSVKEHVAQVLTTAKTFL